jgi:hypothetical protein
MIDHPGSCSGVNDGTPGKNKTHVEERRKFSEKAEVFSTQNDNTKKENNGAVRGFLSSLFGSKKYDAHIENVHSPNIQV